MSTFEAAIPIVMAHEGGWVCDPSDLGGETNFGWSTLTIKRLGLTATDLGVPGPLFAPGYLRAMPRAKALELYRTHFWLPAYSDIADQIVATKMFDFAINAGPGNAHRVAQRAAGVTEDGVLGPKTVAVINVAGAAFRAPLCRELAAYYEHIIAVRPDNAKFRSNWLRRAAWVG